MSGRKRTATKKLLNSSVISIDDDSDYCPSPAKRTKTVKEKKGTEKTRAKSVEQKSKNTKKISKKEVDDTDENEIDDIKQKKSSIAIKSSFHHEWSTSQLLAELQDLDEKTSANIVRLFDDDNTIPFICRYRRELTGDIDADRMRDIKQTYNHIQNIQSRAQTITRELNKKGVLNDEIKLEIFAAKSLDELDHLYAPYKSESKSTLVERAKALGLEDLSMSIISGSSAHFNLQQFISKDIDGLENVTKIFEGIQHIISHVFSKDSDVLELVRTIFNRKGNGIKIQTKKSKSPSTKTSKDTKKSKQDAHKSKSIDEKKFELYFEYENHVDNIQSHQILAINRAENLKFISVKIIVPSRIEAEIRRFIEKKHFTVGKYSKEREKIMREALDVAYNKKLYPLISRQIRSKLTKDAEKESIEVFGKNLKQLLLLHPVKGKKILGIDPGFKNGCKLALISERNEVLETAVIYPHSSYSSGRNDGMKLTELLRKYQCELIAIGNGTACRETENWITSLLRDGILNKNSVKYCIVSENGASIYSCSEIAKKEFPEMDVNLISAVSIARRLSDPLAELIKIEPKHLGVGMYQHDVNEKLLMESLNEVVMECVSFVGVDINTSSVTLLRHIAGLSASRAENIIKYRTENGPFKTRDDLKKVKSIGDKTFIQCAGFIRIEPLTANLSSNDYNKLDSTWVHPESYDISLKILRKIGLRVKEIGSNEFIVKVQGYFANNPLTKISKEFGVPAERIQSIYEGLIRPLNRDYRDDADITPIFKQGLQKINDLKVGTIADGVVVNVTPFGAFIDIGVEESGLIHVSKMNGKILAIGNRVSTEVINVEISRRRVQLKLVNVL